MLSSSRSFDKAFRDDIYEKKCSHLIASHSIQTRGPKRIFSDTTCRDNIKIDRFQIFIQCDAKRSEQYLQYVLNNVKTSHFNL